MFWRAPVYWDRGGIPLDDLAAALSVVILGARGLLVVGNLVFIFASLAALVSRRVRDAWKIQPFHILLAGSVWATSVASSLMDHGDNPRFLVPLQTVVVYLVLWVAYQSWQVWLKPGRTKEVAEHA